MSYPRTPIETLKLTGSKNLRRALKYPPLPQKNLAKREELMEMWDTLVARREEALEDLKKNGTIIFEDAFNRGRLYQKKVVNPAMKIVEKCEAALLKLAKHFQVYASEEKSESENADKKPATLSPVEELERSILKGVN